VWQNLVAVGYRPHFDTPKSDKGRRIDLDAATVAALRSLRKRQAEERLALGPDYQDSGLVFTHEDGTLLHPDRCSKLFDAHVESSGLPRIPLRSMRHTWATLALRAGQHPKVVQERLGHSSISVTMDIYSDSIPSMQKEAADAVAALFTG
jgi:integrase